MCEGFDEVDTQDLKSQNLCQINRDVSGLSNVNQDLPEHLTALFASSNRYGSYPLPRIEDSLDALRGSEWFSTQDLQSDFWQVPMKTCDAEKTSFVTNVGLFQFKVMPFGLCNGPATFQCLMECVLSGLNYEICLLYIDDIIMFSETLEQHIDYQLFVINCKRQVSRSLQRNVV